ncbi:phosphohydrolase [Lactiplantibacillus garii]|uniref:Phosphohydrolase n=1 Tax=Lactiplantibacillus garii TaxID=2306423 RepID=A0A426D673_9LACO|nr:phosphohydrolase [Lactiplantibacillus garii]RRK10125.1 phosphohydrolase [Lactiplantibacillus garii]
MIGEQNTPLFVCGIVGDQQTMIVNKCLTGPFKNRYDLATAPWTSGTTLGVAVSRITKLQTGLTTVVSKQLGTVQFKLPGLTSLGLPSTMISIFYLLEPVGGQLMVKRPAYTAALSAGAARVPLSQLNWQNSSPTVMQAKRFLMTGAFPIADQPIAAYQVAEKTAWVDADLADY